MIKSDQIKSAGGKTSPKANKIRVSTSRPKEEQVPWSLGTRRGINPGRRRINRF